MTTAKDRIEFRESSSPPSYYSNYLIAQQNGKHALGLFWGLLRHQLEQGSLDVHVDAAYLRLTQPAMQNCNSVGSAAVKGGLTRVTFSFGDPGIKARCLSIAAAYRLSMADTVRLLLIASQLHDAHKTAVTIDPIGSDCSRPVSPAAGMHALTAPAPIAMAHEPLLNENKETTRTQFCKDTQQWKMFKPMRPNATMTTERLKDISAMGGAYEVMDTAELAQHGLSNPVAVSTDDVQADAQASVPSTGANVIEIRSTPQTPPATTSRQAQNAFALSMFAAAERMLENAA